MGTRYNSRSNLFTETNRDYSDGFDDRVVTKQRLDQLNFWR